MISRLSSLSIFLGLFISESAARYVCPSTKAFSDYMVGSRADEIYALGERLDSQRGGQSEYGGIKFIGSKDSGYFAFEGSFDPQEKTERIYRVQVVYSTKKTYLIEITHFRGGKTTNTCDGP
ncbi:BgtE-40011 [Blumeria graminis f. sp. tritici]|uniref:BgtE-40011 n=1 Tax=Blumeria graminis f. sp. tritici TaxID=62690 RepID=A0A9X9PRX3_BLUGR|nr:BgtE-40011 [Blumeria graminis f. sp. tritici]